MLCVNAYYFEENQKKMKRYKETKPLANKAFAVAKTINVLWEDGIPSHRPKQINQIILSLRFFYVFIYKGTLNVIIIRKVIYGF